MELSKIEQRLYEELLYFRHGSNGDGWWYLDFGLDWFSYKPSEWMPTVESLVEYGLIEKNIVDAETDIRCRAMNPVEIVKAKLDKSKNSVIL